MGLFEFFLIVILIGSIFISADGFKHDKERIRIVREKQATDEDAEYEKVQESLLVTGVDNSLEGEGGR